MFLTRKKGFTLSTAEGPALSRVEGPALSRVEGSARRARTWTLWAAGLAVCAAGMGCSTPNISKTPASLADQPRADEATELRGWPQSVAVYQTGTTQGWGTRRFYTTYSETSTAPNVIADSLMTVAQAVALPVTVAIDYPFRKVYYEGDVLPPTYTAMPPLAPEHLYRPPNPDPDPITMDRAHLLPPIPPVPVEHAAFVPLPPPAVVPAKPVAPKPAVVAPPVAPKPAVVAPPVAPKPTSTVTPPATRPAAK